MSSELGSAGWAARPKSPTHARTPAVRATPTRTLVFVRDMVVVLVLLFPEGTEHGLYLLGHQRRLKRIVFPRAVEARRKSALEPLFHVEQIAADGLRRVTS